MKISKFFTKHWWVAALIAVFVYGLVTYAALPQIVPDKAMADLCTSTGGRVVDGSCCQAVNSFPNTCSIGACGCSPFNSHTVKTCDCYNGKETLVALCFDPQVGCKSMV